MAAALGIGDAFVARDPLGPLHGKSLVRIRPVFSGFEFRVSLLGFRVSLFGFRDSGFPKPAAIPSLRVSRANPSYFSGFGFRVSGFGFRVSGLEFRSSGFGFRASGFGFRVSGLGLWFSGFCLLIPDFGLRVSGFGIRDLFMRLVLSLLLASSSDPCKSRVWR